MLTITKIIEGGIDLASQTELPRSMVISNGFREITVAMSEHEMEHIVQLYIEGLGMERTSHANQVVHAVEELVGHDAVEAIAREEDRKVSADIARAQVKVAVRKPAENIQMKFQVGDPDSDYNEPPTQSDIDDSGFEPGEEYDDGGTGVASL